MLPTILPSGVVACEARGDDGAAALFAAEHAALGRVAEGRRREFATTRACAHRALERLGRPAAAILRGADREPLWPPGVVGSLTHCSGYRAAAVACDQAFWAIGIDAELHRPIEPRIVARISDAEERRWMRRLGPGGTFWEVVLFSAKESIYKAWYPLTHRWLDFTDVSLRIDPERATLSARLRVEPPIVDGRPLDRFEGRFAAGAERVVTFVGVPRARERR